ncbi:MAG TPA: hypothetical protein VN615_09045 [Gaiellales bacterium]|nr:hypothetical protein [Gaiellales bacterium]
MTDTPQGIQIGRHRDLRGREWHGWLRRGLLLIPTAIVVLALANVFGQHPATSTASTSAATMSVFAPTSVRGGLIWEARFDVHAVRTIRHARLVLDSDWLEANTVNTIEPSPSRETSRNGALELDLGRLPAGRRHLLFMQFQTNPTNVGRRTVTVALLDGNQQLLRISRTLTVFP